MADNTAVRLESNALTTLEVTLSFLGLAGTEDEEIRGVVTRLINSASAYIETMTDRKFGRQDYTETLSAGGGQDLCLKQYPIVAVAEVRDVAMSQIVPPDSYDLQDGAIGVLHRDRGWAERGFRSGLANDITSRARYIRVAYTAGYILPKDGTEEQPSDLPYDLQMIVWQMVQQQWTLAQSGAAGLSAFSVSDMSWTFDKALSEQVTNIIQQYRRWA